MKVHNRAVLGEQDVLEIHRRTAAGETRAALGRAYGVDPTTISNIANGRTWHHLLPEGVTPVSRNSNAKTNEQGRGKPDRIRVYRDLAGLMWWKRQNAEGRFLGSPDEGFRTHAEARADMERCNPDWQECRVVDHAADKASQ